MTVTQIRKHMACVMTDAAEHRDLDVIYLLASYIDSLAVLASAQTDAHTSFLEASTMR